MRLFDVHINQVRFVFSSFFLLPAPDYILKKMKKTKSCQLLLVAVICLSDGHYESLTINRYHIYNLVFTFRVRIVWGAMKKTRKQKIV